MNIEHTIFTVTDRTHELHRELQESLDAPRTCMRLAAELYTTYASLHDLMCSQLPVLLADKALGECQGTIAALQGAIDTGVGRDWRPTMWVMASSPEGHQVADRLYKLAIDTIQACGEEWGAMAPRGLPYRPYAA